MTEYRGDGLRAQRIQDQRERELEDLEIRKKKLTDNLEMKDIANKFSATYDSVAGEISAATVSLLLHHKEQRIDDKMSLIGYYS